VLELPADRGQCEFQILECLHRLQAKIAAELALLIIPELTGDVDKTGVNALMRRWA
jgi:hypothetical protein